MLSLNYSTNQSSQFLNGQLDTQLNGHSHSTVISLETKKPSLRKKAERATLLKNLLDSIEQKTELMLKKLSGNIVHNKWIRHICQVVKNLGIASAGKAHSTLLLFSEIVYLFRPRRNEPLDKSENLHYVSENGVQHLVLKVGYNHFQENFCLSRRQVYERLMLLKRLGWINIVYGSVKTSLGTLPNVVGISLNFENFAELTHPDYCQDLIERQQMLEKVKALEAGSSVEMTDSNELTSEDFDMLPNPFGQAISTWSPTFAPLPLSSPQKEFEIKISDITSDNAITPPAPPAPPAPITTTPISAPATPAKSVSSTLFEGLNRPENPLFKDCLYPEIEYLEQRKIEEWADRQPIYQWQSFPWITSKARSWNRHSYYEQFLKHIECYLKKAVPERYEAMKKFEIEGAAKAWLNKANVSEERSAAAWIQWEVFSATHKEEYEFLVSIEADAQQFNVVVPEVIPAGQTIREYLYKEINTLKSAHQAQQKVLQEEQEKEAITQRLKDVEEELIVYDDALSAEENTAKVVAHLQSLVDSIVEGQPKTPHQEKASVLISSINLARKKPKNHSEVEIRMIQSMKRRAVRCLLEAGINPVYAIGKDPETGRDAITLNFLLAWNPQVSQIPNITNGLGMVELFLERYNFDLRNPDEKPKPEAPAPVSQYDFSGLPWAE